MRHEEGVPRLLPGRHSWMPPAWLEGSVDRGVAGTVVFAADRHRRQIPYVPYVLQRAKVLPVQL